MRGGNLPSLPALGLADTITLERTPVFRWQEPEPGLVYQFTLKDPRGSTLYYREVSGGALQLPAENALEDGAAYTWVVRTRTRGGRFLSAQYAVRTADAALRTAAADLEPGADASVAERVAYAAWLAQNGLIDAAEGQWQALQREGIVRPRRPGR
jgi:hypothetical protein